MVAIELCAAIGAPAAERGRKSCSGTPTYTARDNEVLFFIRAQRFLLHTECGLSYANPAECLNAAGRAELESGASVAPSLCLAQDQTIESI